MAMFEVCHYLTPDGKDVFLEWLRQIRDPTAKLQITQRINRFENGNFGDHKFCRDGVWEMRVHVGLGYRVYYARAGSQLLILLAGGNKNSQTADIERAVGHWLDWQKRKPL
jgi:putative addiction module killer protein